MVDPSLLLTGLCSIVELGTMERRERGGGGERQWEGEGGRERKGQWGIENMRDGAGKR